VTLLVNGELGLDLIIMKEKLFTKMLSDMFTVEII
jgi:hypothetical protein